MCITYLGCGRPVTHRATDILTYWLVKRSFRIQNFHLLYRNNIPGYKNYVFIQLYHYPVWQAATALEDKCMNYLFI